MGQSLERLVSPMSNLSLSLSLFLPLPPSLFTLIPWNTEALCVYLFAQPSKIQVRGSPRQGTLHYSSGRQWPM